MPLIILGLFVIVGISIYALIKYENSVGDDDRTVRERYPHAFPPKKDAKDIFDSFMNIDESDPNGQESENSNDGNTIKFPDNAELEKRKRNIH